MTATGSADELADARAAYQELATGFERMRDEVNDLADFQLFADRDPYTGEAYVHVDHSCGWGARLERGYRIGDMLLTASTHLQECDA